MSIRHGATAIFVATSMFGSAVRNAAAGNEGVSRTTVSVCENTRAHRVPIVASPGKDDIVQRRAATFKATSKDSRSNGAVREGAAAVTELSINASAITYWVSESDGWDVVTTVDIQLGQNQDDETRKQAVVRFSAVLLPGQLQRIWIGPRRNGGPSFDDDCSRS